MTVPLEYLFVMPESFDHARRYKTNRMHNRALKKAIRATLIRHVRRTMPKHFKQHARAIYKHKPRSEAWIRKKWKEHRSRLDLVASRRTEDRMTRRFSSRQVSVGGNASSAITGTLKLRFPFPTSKTFKAPTAKTVTPSDMARELERWSRRDQREAALFIQQKYVRNVREELRKEPKIRIRIKAQVAHLGGSGLFRS